MSLTLADLKEVYRTTFEARNKWKNILLELDVSHTEIQAIEVRNHDHHEDCYREGLSTWLNDGTERTWRDLVKALSSPTVGYMEIAKRIEQTYNQPTLTNASASQSSDGASLNVQIINENLTIFAKENLGSGAFGEVFKGSFTCTRPCAVKVLHQVAMLMRTNLTPGQGNETAIAAFDRECKFLKSFQHPNVVQHLSTERHPSGGMILVTELMDCNLRSYLSGLGGESLTSHCQVSLSKDVASGLAYIHSRQVIHRDLCGDNILLHLNQPVPTAKISDFGMSRLLDPSQMSSTLTAVSHRMGYLPPEALRLEDEKYDHSLDVFSLGVIMVQIICKVETVKTAKERSSLYSQIPTTHKLKTVISNCLNKDMRRRPTVKEVCSRLERGMEVEEEDMDTIDMPVTAYASIYYKQELDRGSLTVADLKRRTGISDAQLDTHITNGDIIKLASLFDDVIPYLDKLQLTAGQQTDIMDLAIQQGKRTAMAEALRLWRQLDPFAATFRALLKILLTLRRGDVAVRVCQYITE